MLIGSSLVSRFRFNSHILSTRMLPAFHSTSRRSSSSAIRACLPTNKNHSITDTSSTSTTPPFKTILPKFSFCPVCGGPSEERLPKGDHELRNICTACGFVHYQNPKMVVGCLVEHENKVLLCRRSIQPSYGLWTLPAGYMELGESAAAGAVRETLEEAQARVEPISMFAHLDIPLIGQSYIIFRARFTGNLPEFSPGPESLECELFPLDQIPFSQIAFSTINVALQLYIKDVNDGHLRVHSGVIEKKPGASPSDPQGFLLRDYLRTP